MYYNVIESLIYMKPKKLFKIRKVYYCKDIKLQRIFGFIYVLNALI